MAHFGGFDQVIAISQGKINHDLHNRYNHEAAADLKQFSAHSPDDKDGLMEATLSSPTVELYVSDEPQKAIFRLNFDDGHFDYPEGDKLQRLSMKGWSMAFLSRLTPSQIAQVPPELRPIIPDEIIHKIEMPGSYSLSQILIDMGTAHIVNFDFSRSVTPGLNALADSDAPKKQALEKFIKIYLELLIKKQCNVLGYAISVKENQDAPTFVPVSVSIQTMPCADIQDPTAMRDRNPALDALIFLEMTTKETIPAPLKFGYPWIPEGQYGIMAIHNRIIWRKFLLKALLLFVIDAFQFANTTGNWLRPDSMTGDLLGEGRPWVISNSQHFPNPDGNGLDAWKNVTSKSAKFSWSDDRIGQSKIWAENEKERWETWIDVEVNMSLGTHIVKITTKCTVRYTKYEYPPPSPFSSIVHRERVAKATTSWDTDVAFESAHGGHLSARATVGAPKCSAEVDKPMLAILGHIFEKTTPDDYMTDKVQKYLKEKFKADDLTNIINGRLSHLAPFAFPGKGALLMKSPMFVADIEPYLQVYLHIDGSQE